jgi:hypothetical protein
MILQRLQFLAGFEAYRLAGRDADFLAGTRITSYAGFARAHIEHAEAAQFDSFAFAQSSFHGFENRLDGFFGLGSAHSGFTHDRIHYIKLNHTSLLRSDGKLC